MRVEREAFTKLLRCFYSAADLDHMVTKLNGEEPTFKMLTPVLYVLEKRRQLAHDLVQSATRSYSPSWLTSWRAFVYSPKAKTRDAAATKRTLLIEPRSRMLALDFLQ